MDEWTREQAEALGWHVWGPVGQTLGGLGGFWRGERRTHDSGLQSQEAETLGELLGCIRRWHEQEESRRRQGPVAPVPVDGEGLVAA